MLESQHTPHTVSVLRGSREVSAPEDGLPERAPIAIDTVVRVRTQHTNVSLARLLSSSFLSTLPVGANCSEDTRRSREQARRHHERIRRVPTQPKRPPRRAWLP